MRTTQWSNALFVITSLSYQMLIAHLWADCCSLKEIIKIFIWYRQGHGSLPVCYMQHTLTCCSIKIVFLHVTIPYSAHTHTHNFAQLKGQRKWIWCELRSVPSQLTPFIKGGSYIKYNLLDTYVKIVRYNWI